jgi:hypothetical protein
MHRLVVPCKMKKIILLLPLLFVLPVKAQFLNSYGMTLGMTRAKQQWAQNQLPLPEKTRHRTGFNGSFLLEFFSHDVFTWVSELQFNQKGGRFLNANNDVYFKGRSNYASFNNYLKARTEGIDMNMYILAGPRINYMISSNVPGGMPFGLSAAGGIGFDLTYWEPTIFFAEVLYGHDILPAHPSPPSNVYNKGWEFRIGIKKRIERRGYCPPAFNPAGHKRKGFIVCC